MEEVDILGAVIAIVFGVFNILLGYLVKKFEMADILAGYDDKKHGKNGSRKRLCDIFGSHFMLMGLLMILVSGLYYFGFLSGKLFSFTLASVIVTLFVKMMYSMNK